MKSILLLFCVLSACKAQFQWLQMANVQPQQQRLQPQPAMMMQSFASRPSPQFQQQTFQMPMQPLQQPVQSFQPPIQSFQQPIQSFQQPIQSFQQPIQTFQQQQQPLGNSPLSVIKSQIANSQAQRGPLLAPRLLSSVVPRFCSFKETIKCDSEFPYRTLDGSCNNLENSWWGKAETPYKRMLDPDYADKISAPRASIDGTELPNPKELVCALHGEAHEIEPFITHMFMQWGQVVNHDITSLSISTDDERNFSVCNSCMRTEKCFPIQIASNDTCNCISQMRHTCIEFTRSTSAFGDLKCEGERREQLNLQTPYLDGSLIYGVKPKENRRLRDKMNGKGALIMQAKTQLLPKDPTKTPSDCLDFTDERRCFVSGDDRVNQNPGLMSVHTLLTREHNRIAGILSKLNPSWEDETVFQEARRVVIALIQHVTYNEYLPILLGESIVTQMNLKPEQGKTQTSFYNPSVDPRVYNEYSAAAGRFGHSMIRSVYSRADSKFNTIGSFMLRNQYFRPYLLYDDNGGMESVVRGFLKDPLMKVDRWFTEDISKHLFESADDFGRPFHFDLVSINIQRGRDHGVPAYVKFREPCGLPAIRSWADMRNYVHGDVVDIFMRFYRFVEDVDLFSASVAEFKQDGAIIGPTLACILSQQFRDLKFGDRFWYETSSFPANFTPAQLAEIRKLSLSKLLCRNLKDTPMIQPKAMLSSKLKDNALVNCTELSDINWKFWKV